ncbi:MAG TPA: M43 family zinc metalloprotease, partial [Chitinophagaceae bacterium]
MKKRILVPTILFSFCLITAAVKAQDQPLKTLDTPQRKGHIRIQRCSTMEALQEAIKKDPSLPEKWRIEGERQYNLYLQRQQQISARALNTNANPIIIPIVFHLVDDSSTLAGIADRDIIEQVEILNKDYNGSKMNSYLNVIPPEIAARIGKIPVKFVLARRAPNGTLTNGIERRAGATPDHVSIKSFATGGLDAWDSSKYLNVWCGTFTNSDAGLLGISTFPFTSDEGPQGCVIGIKTLPMEGNISRSYYAEYSEGSTLSHEIGHYFYLWHTFGDQSTCNNNDFQIETGWPLPLGAGPEGDDTPESKGTGSNNYVYGDPSMNYNDGCAAESFGIMYGSFMNYFDDRALFMFSDGMRKRVEGCINLYRPGLLTTDGATPP